MLVNPSLRSGAGLRALVDRHVYAALLQAVVAEHEGGRRLGVSTAPGGALMRMSAALAPIAAVAMLLVHAMRGDWSFVALNCALAALAFKIRAGRDRFGFQ